MRTQRVASIALLAASLCGCLSYQPPPPLEERPDPPAPIRVYVLQEMALPDENAEPLTPRQLANLLKSAGFEAVVATEMAEVPPDAPFVARGTDETGDCSDSVLETVFFDLTLGLYPQHRCLKFGYSFELHRSVSGPVEDVRTDWQMPMILGWLAIPLGGLG